MLYIAACRSLEYNNLTLIQALSALLKSKIGNIVLKERPYKTKTELVLFQKRYAVQSYYIKSKGQ